MTPKQIELARHALGLTQKKLSYRNYFVAGKGHVDHGDWDQMVEQGVAGVMRNAGTGAEYDVFWMTAAGAKAVLRTGEALDREDFPVTENP